MSDNAVNDRMRTVGECVDFGCELTWVTDVIHDGLLGEPHHRGRATVAVRVEASGKPFDVSGWELLARGVQRRRGHVVIENVCSSGFDLLARPLDDRVEFIFRWRPALRVRADRAFRGAVPSADPCGAASVSRDVVGGHTASRTLHASVVTSGGATPLIEGGGGVGKSNALQHRVHGGRASELRQSVRHRRVDGVGARRADASGGRVGTADASRPPRGPLNDSRSR